MPAWLSSFVPGVKPDVESVLRGRCVFYPGAGFDGQPVELFASSYFAHTFIYVDYGIERNRVEAELDDPQHGFKGYNLLDRISLSPTDLTPAGWTPHIRRDEVTDDRDSFSNITPYAFLQILGRDSDHDSTHGPERIAILFIGGDGIATYDAMFCQGGRRPPVAMVIQDHGYGGQYARFDHDGLLHRLATRTGQFPELLLLADNSTAWTGYECVEDHDRVYGGCHQMARQLFKKLP